MGHKVFINLPVKDLDRSMGFFKSVGFDFNQQFTDKTAACMVISDEIYAMLLTHQKFGEFTKKTIVDAHSSTEVLVALSCDSKADVDQIADRALEAGGSMAREPKDHGFMYERSFEDPDGHIWELFWMDPKAVEQQ